MRDPTPIEIEGMMAASEKGGAYLDRIGKTDLATMTNNEWMSFLETAIRAYEEKTMELYGDPPF